MVFSIRTFVISFRRRWIARFQRKLLTQCARVWSIVETCVEATEKGIFLASTRRDVAGDIPESTGEDSELDETVQIFDLEGLDFDDEDEDGLGL
jgi:hypothetical protein